MTYYDGDHERPTIISKITLNFGEIEPPVFNLCWKPLKVPPTIDLTKSPAHDNVTTSANDLSNPQENISGKELNIIQSKVQSPRSRNVMQLFKTKSFLCI